MSRSPSIERAADLAAFACLAELAAEKPGNVTLRRGLPGLSPCAFLHSASALRAAFSRRRGRSVGRLVLETIRRTRPLVRTNTNLGLALILAPLAIASSRRSSCRESLRARVRAVLRRLTLGDARDAYEAIRMAEPGGLGRVKEVDVAGRPDRDLRACMALAAGRDSIAAEYARDYALTFGVGAPALRGYLKEEMPLQEAIVMAFLKILSTRPDSLIARNRGLPAARRVSRRAAEALKAGGTRTAPGRRKVAALDRALRASRLNPGTTADLTAAAIFVTFCT